MPRDLPQVTLLRAAVKEVIRINTEDGITPTRFIQITWNGDLSDQELHRACESLILKSEILEILETGIKRGSLLTLEDFIAEHGKEWQFNDDVIRQAIARVKYFDLIAGSQRYYHIFAAVYHLGTGHSPACGAKFTLNSP
jgi:hypothetical protein